ncbi:MAG: antitoxin AF2212-like protein [Pirellulales bacterium]
MESAPIDAVYENGAFRPVQPLPVAISDGQQVRLRIEATKAATILEMACSVYDGLTADDVADVERIGFDRTHFFTANSSAN